MGSYSLKGKGEYLRGSDVVKNFDDNISARSSEGGFYNKRGGAVVGAARNE